MLGPTLSGPQELDFIEAGHDGNVVSGQLCIDVLFTTSSQWAREEGNMGVRGTRMWKLEESLVPSTLWRLSVIL